MKELTKKILKEEADKYFPKICSEGEFVQDYNFINMEIPVFPEYKKRKEEGKEDCLCREESTGFMMNEYISGMIDLACHLIDNKYPTTTILGILPRDFSLKVVRRLI